MTEEKSIKDGKLTAKEKSRIRKFFKKLMKKKYGIVIASLLLAALVVFVLYQSREKTPVESDVEFHFVDVGQGDGAMVITKDACVVIDCGPSASTDSFVRHVREYTDKIDLLVFSHPHEDHMGGASKVLAGFEVSRVLMTTHASEASFFGRALDVIERKNIPVTEAKPGSTFTVGDITVEVLAPSNDYGDMNDNSTVVRVSSHGTSCLFTGDAGSASEEEMLKANVEKLDADILKVGHHGSSSATTGPFLEAVSPEIAVISCGKNNDYGHPHKSTVSKLKKADVEYYRTDEDGTVVLYAAEGKISKK